MGCGLQGQAGLWCLDGQVPCLTHKQPGNERSSSGSRSLSSVPGTLSCQRRDGQYGGGVTHQLPGRLPVTHPRKACAPTSPLGTGKMFVPETGPCPRGPEPSDRLSVETVTQVRGMDAKPSDGGSYLGTIPHGRGGSLCVAGVDPMPPLVLPFSPHLSGDRCANICPHLSPLAGHETIRFPSGQAHPSGLVQGEDVRSLPSLSSPVLAFPDVVFGVGLPSGRRSVGDSNQERPVVSAPGQNLAPTSRDLEVVGMADQGLPITFDLSDGVHETINSARALSTRRLYSSKWRVFESWCLAHGLGCGPSQLPSWFSAGVPAR